MSEESDLKNETQTKDVDVDKIETAEMKLGEDGNSEDPIISLIKEELGDASSLQANEKDKETEFTTLVEVMEEEAENDKPGKSVADVKKDEPKDALLLEKFEELDDMHAELINDITTETGDEEVTTHPYAYLTDNLQPTPEDLTTCELFDVKSVTDSSYSLIQNKNALINIVALLRTQKELGVNVIQDPSKTYKPLVCFLVISTRDKDYLIDTLQLKGEILLLTEIFINPKILKIVSKADYILRRLHDLNLFAVNVFDIDSAASAFDGKPASYLQILKQEYGYNKNQNLNKFNFQGRPVHNKDMIEYIRSQCHYLIHLYCDYKNKLINKDVEVYKQVLKASNESSKYIRSEKALKDHSISAALEEFKRRQKCEIEVLYKLYKWRDESAKKLNIHPNIIFNNAALKTLSFTLPTTINGVGVIIKSQSCTIVHLTAILNVILDTMKAYNFRIRDRKLRRSKPNESSQIANAGNSLKRKINTTPQKQQQLTSPKPMYSDGRKQTPPYKVPRLMQGTNHPAQQTFGGYKKINQHKKVFQQGNQGIYPNQRFGGNQMRGQNFGPPQGFNSRGNQNFGGPSNSRFQPNNSNFPKPWGDDMNRMDEAVLKTALEVLTQNRNRIAQVDNVHNRRFPENSNTNFNPNRQLFNSGPGSGGRELNSIDQRINELQRKISHYQPDRRNRDDNMFHRRN